MRLAEIEKLVDLVASSQVAGLTVETPGRKLSVRKWPGAGGAYAELEAEEAGLDYDGAEPAGEPAEPAGPRTVWINSPMVGIFYPSEPPVKIGDEIAVGDVVGVIESMKLMNDIRAEAAGVVSEMVIEPGHAVEYGQPLFALGAGEERQGEAEEGDGDD